MANSPERDKWGNGFHVKRMYADVYRHKKHTQAQKKWIKAVEQTG